MPRTLLLAAALLLGFTSIAAAQDFDADGEAAMLERINAMRTERQLTPVQRLDTLDAAARGHSVEMSRTGQLSHVSEASGTPEDRARAVGVEATRVTENVASHRDTAGAQGALEQSAPHLANILDPAVTHVGLGSVRTERGVFVTQLYSAVAAPQEAAPAPPEPVLEPAPVPEADPFALIPPFVERAMEEAAGPLANAATGAGGLLAPNAGSADSAPADAPAAPAPQAEDAAPNATAPNASATTAPNAPAPNAPAPNAPATPNADAPAAPATGASANELQTTLQQLVGIAQSLLGSSQTPNR